MTSDDARPVMGDVTNRPLKRGFSLISGKFVLKSADARAKSLSNEEEDSNFAKQVCLGVNNLVKEKCAITGSVSSKPIDVNDTVLNNQTAAIDVSRTNSVSSEKEITTGATSEVATSEGFVTSLVSGNLNKDLGGSIESSKLPNAQSSRSFEFEKCTARQFEGCANISTAADLLKACSCSFCLTAAYIWSDLHYQDIKGRIAALKKSQKEACFLVQKNGKEEGIDIHGRAKSLKVESDLTGHWRTLFLQMEDMFARESAQLQGSFGALKDLRENCKMDLERSTGMHPDKH